MNAKLECVMLIDDNEDDNFFHRLILEESGLAQRVQVAEGGPEALEYLRKEDKAPELIFLDINMPKMNGWEFMHAYDSSRTAVTGTPVVIMLTTSLNPADRERAGQVAAINGFETKPLTLEMLRRIVGEYFPDKG